MSYNIITPLLETSILVQRTGQVGLTDAKRLFIQAIKEGRVESEFRDAQKEKNLLAIGDITLDQVADLISRCKGQEYSSSPHDFDPSTEVHVFKPMKDKQRWYIKGYLLSEKAVFISVHRSEYRR
jgi:hypothetical protein